ncbi:MAG: hypothetical protein IJ007_08085 [Oscillospiraceae bacterium]|nr:hypothetical protein [Oscillospiraceae bacterium]
MKESRYRIIKSILAAAAAALMLSACNGAGDDVYWEDTLPSASLRTSAEILVITEDPLPPISIDVPDVTTAVSETKDTELATTTTTVAVPTTVTTTVTPVETESLISTVSGVPTVVLPEFTSSTTAGAVVTKVTTSSLESAESASENIAQVSEITGGTITDDEHQEFSVKHTTVTYSPFGTTSLSLETGVNNDGDQPYVFNDPIQDPYCYTTLEGDKKEAYELIVKAIEKHDSKITFPDSVSITAAEYCDLYQMIYNSEHNIYYIDTQMKYTTNVKTQRIVSAELCYIYTEDEVKTMQKKIDAAADKIIDGITDEMTEYDIVKYFYDTLVKGCVYDIEAENCRDMYGCLVNGRAVCGGYAKAFNYLCDNVGISSLTITGDFDEVPHMWNMVRIGGEWYQIDVTSGVVTNSDNNYIRYDYFCVTDEMNSRTHKVYDQPYSYPAAVSDKYNYYVYNNLVANTVDEAVELVNMGILSAAENGSNVIQFACATDEVFEDTVYALFDKSQAKALTIYEKAYAKAAKKYNRESIVYNQEKDTRVIKLFLDYLD